LYPLLQVLSFNWLRFRWGFRRGLAPLPPDVEAHAKSVDRGLALASQVLLLIAVAYILRSSSLSMADVGLTLANWKRALVYGSLLSLVSLLLGGLGRMARNFNLTPPDPAGLRLSRFVLRSVSTELWRAFCIIALIHLDVARVFAVVIAAAVGALMHLYKNMVFAGTFTFGFIAGFLFVSTRSLIAPLAMVLIGGIGNDWLDSATRFAAARKLSQKCPMCSAVIEENLVPRRLRYICPSCGAQLTLSLKQWQIQTLNMAFLQLTALVLYALHVGLFLGVILIAPAHVLLMFIVFALLPQLAPRLYSLHPDVDPYKGVEPRLR
jgi:Type II CAAX prenyl endopeptidase Rce1-like